ncbi:MAG: histidine--tRNA ligase [Eubacteriales bacterium]|jgi:histidyl-tRNA synthetase|nr:histidine--tRNA ligase [Eubacteriales bacterium]
MIQKPRGTIDILPDESPVWRFIEDTARKVASNYGYGEIRFPTFEATELFMRGVGNDTDVVQKEMYTFYDRDNRSLTLRPEGTACVARSVIENSLYADSMPLRLYYLSSCFRYEKPQAGRSREFYQFGAELFGAATAVADAEIISLADAIIRNIGIKSVSLHINTLGCSDCRPRYHSRLKEYYKLNISNLCETCRDRLETNPLRILDCKNNDCVKLREGVPKTIDFLCDDCGEHFEILKRTLTKIGIDYRINTNIVRGLDYYTRTVFEFISDDIGAQGTLCGGGRYDGLIEAIGGPSTTGIGFAMGITRLILALKSSDNNIKSKYNENPLLYIASLGETASVHAVSLAEKLRAGGIFAECDIIGRSLKAQMKYADKKGAAFTLILGDNEIESGKAQLKNMRDGSQTPVDINDTDILRRLLGYDK